MSITEILLVVINFAGSLAVFLFAMKMMSEGLQKVAGSRMRSVLGKITGKPFSGILTGAAVTAAIQSSSATTVMVVGFVNAGLLSLSSAVAVIMGANIGTTATAWIISLLGIGGGGGYFDLPLFIAALSLGLLFSRRDRMKSLAQTVIGLSLILVGMRLLQGSMPNLQNYPDLLHGIAALSGHGFWSVVLFVLIGAALTCILQASAATMAITLLMCHNGWIGLDMAVALVMGENIGTTITANIAALVANSAGKKAARAHLVFNVLGTALVLCLFNPVVGFVRSVFPHDMPMAISLFHTIFNVGNTCILVWFIPQILWIVERLVPQRDSGGGHADAPRLSYISRGPVSTAELNLESAKKEIQLFSKQVLRMYALLPELHGAHGKKEFNETLLRIERYEQLTDQMEMELSQFLTAAVGGGLSAHASKRVGTMLRVADNLESIGDSILQIALTLKNKRSDAVHFGQDLNENLNRMAVLVENALLVMDTNLANYERADLDAAYEAEREVNACRDRLRAGHIDALKSGAYSYAVGSAYSNLYAQYEKLADYAINVSEAIDDSHKHEPRPSAHVAG